MRNLISKIVFVFVLGLSFHSHASKFPLTFYCIDDQNELELYVYQSTINGLADEFTLKKLRTGDVVNKKVDLTIGANPNKIMVWNRPNNHGGGSLIFFARLVDGVLIGSGFGLSNAKCLVESKF
jgi:hypothetical protein